ncbi:hypothetical protein [Paraburkholderia sp. UCT2]|uniref:hypothetical protein n=1 Tax=Paraburkholderia sp. UCT2 TaxID=2615208 RepID=UPI001655589B|nr:hypothetical protein [Paraburkholderia sp. UCT2]MBC8732859.1 hypothetical protein [Paraburkholderia sp. UCT2]
MRRAAHQRRWPLCPEIPSLMNYGERVVEVVAEARGRRVTIESVDGNGRRFRSAVKWKNLTALDAQLF